MSFARLIQAIRERKGALTGRRRRSDRGLLPAHGDASPSALLHRYGPLGCEKNTPALLNEDVYDAWPSARPMKAKEFIREYAAQSLLVNPLEKRWSKVPRG